VAKLLDEYADRAGSPAARPQEENPETSGTVSAWRGAAPEVLAAVVVVAATALAGWAGLTVVAAATTAAVMVLLRGLLPRLKQDTVKKAQDNRRPLTGYAHRLFVVPTALTTRGRYDSELRPVLNTCWPPGYLNTTTSTCTRTRKQPASCCAPAPGTPTCGAGSTRPARPKARPASAGSRAERWPASSTGWRSSDTPAPGRQLEESRRRCGWFG
jgi:hypothetical protein